MVSACIYIQKNVALGNWEIFIFFCIAVFKLGAQRRWISALARC